MADFGEQVDANCDGEGHKGGFDRESRQIRRDGLLAKALQSGLTVSKSEHCEDNGIGDMSEETGGPGAQTNTLFAVSIGAQVIVKQVVDA